MVKFPGLYLYLPGYVYLLGMYLYLPGVYLYLLGICAYRARIFSYWVCISTVHTVVCRFISSRICLQLKKAGKHTMPQCEQHSVDTAQASTDAANTSVAV